MFKVRWGIFVAVAMAIGNVAFAGTTSTGTRGPSTVDSAYIVPVANGVRAVSILTVGESVNLKPNGTPYRLVGIPDGMGAFSNNDGTFTLVVNHEIRSTLGIARLHHGLTPPATSKGAFVSKWIISIDKLAVQEGSDLIRAGGLNLWDAATQKYVVADPAGTLINLNRLCAGDMAPITAFQFTRTNPDGTTSSLGTRARIFLSGEETDDVGRGFAHIVTGTTGGGVSVELPKFGKFAYENIVANPFGQEKTIVMSLDDGNGGQVYCYVGTKVSTGSGATSDIEKAGLTNGKQYVVVVPGVILESRQTAIGTAKGVETPFTLADIGDMAAVGANSETASDAVKGTEFLRPEDGAWDPSKPADFYFVTTDRFDEFKANIDGTDGTPPNTEADGTNDAVIDQVGRSRLWRLRFTDIANPETGGTIALMVDGTEAHQMFDNLTIDTQGNILIQEDPGNQEYLARIWSYNIASGTLTEVAKHDPARFGDIGVPASSSFNTDEESSGILDASSFLGAGWFLMNVQSHRSTGSSDLESVEKGQILAIFVPGSVPAPVIGTSSSAGKFTFTPAAPVVGTAVVFTGIATAIPTIFWSWDFGDGTTSVAATATATGNTQTKTYTVAGDYSVTATATDTLSGKVTTNTQVITVKDTIRAGTGGANTLKMDIKLKFPAGDSKIVLQGNIPMAFDQALAGPVKLDIGGVVSEFAIDADGNFKSDTAKFRIYKKKRPAATTMPVTKFRYVQTGKFNEFVVDEGLIDKNAFRESGRRVVVKLTIFGKLYDTTFANLYNAKLGQSGRYK